MESESASSSPVLRVTTDISELKDSNECIKHSFHKPVSREDKNHLQGNAFVKKKTLHPIHGCNPYQGKNNHCGSYINIQNAKSNVSTFTQRVMSAKLLRVKQLQNQLAESQSRVSELINENKLLKTLQRRQDYALKKYEGSQEQLPQLIKSHNEEIRVINAKFKQLKLNYKILENKLKERDTELMNLREQHKHLLKLSRDKQLGDREKLTKKLEEMEAQVTSQQEKIQMLSRKLELEGKSYRHRLNLEISRHKETQMDLRDALKTIDNLKSSVEGKPKYVNMTMSKKIVRPFAASSAHANQQSRISLPAPPPNVSIRQPQRLVHSEAAINRDEDSDSDSFSFGLHNMPQNNEDDSCSDRSDSNDEEKPNHLEKNKIKSRNAPSGSVRLLNKHSFTGGSGRSLSSGNSHNGLARSSPALIGLKNVNHPRSMVRSTAKTDSVENKFAVPRVNLTNPVKTEYQVDNLNNISIKDVEDNKMSPSVVPVDNAPRRNSVTTIPMKKGANPRSLDRRYSITNSLKKSVSLESVKSNISEKTNKNETPPQSENDFLTNNYDNELSSMQTEIEKELGNILTKKPEDGTDSLSNENLSNSMEAAIEELERKFKIFDMPQIRKETEDDINKIVDRACRSLEEEMNSEIGSNNIDGLVHSENTNSVKEVDFLEKLEKTCKEVVNAQPDIKLGESQKANLLKALDNIDKEGDNITTLFQDNNENFNSNLHKIQGYPHVSNLMNSRTKRDVINEIFSEEPTVSTK